MEQMLLNFFTWKPLQVIPYQVLCGIIALMLCLSVIIVGVFIHKLERFQLDYFNKIFGQKVSRFIVYRLTFIGTVIHELSHAFMGWLLGAKINEIKLFTFKGDDLGYVKFTCRGTRISKAIQLGMISCAPVLVGFVLVPLILKYGFSFQYPFWLNILSFYVLVSVINHMDMSSVDTKNYLKAIWVVFLMSYGLVYTVRFSVIF